MKNVKTIIRNGKLIDPEKKSKWSKDILVSGNRIVSIVQSGKSFSGLNKSDQVVEIDASNCIVSPGFIDIHVHLREPGFEQKETIRTGTHAAVAGGFTTVACMANTNPVNDNLEVLSFIQQKASTQGYCHVWPIAAVTKGLKGKRLVDLDALKSAGAMAFSDDGHCVMKSDITRLAFRKAADLGVTIISHAEDEDLIGKGAMNEGELAESLGIPGRPSLAEEIMVSRDILFAEDTGANLHISHISTRRSLEMVRLGQKKGVKVTCEATPHHFSLTEKDVGQGNTLFKMAPPLRTAEDREALIEGLADGTIDAVATDHAPHEKATKECDFKKAANGIIGLETALPLLLELVRKRRIKLHRAIYLLTAGPAKIFGMPSPALYEGSLADITIFNPSEEWVYSPKMIRSRSKNSPWINREMKGKVKFTLVNGKVKYRG